jgi:hypothetical protein
VWYVSQEEEDVQESTYSKLENVPFAWYQQTQTSGIPVDGPILREKSLKIVSAMGIENFSDSNSWISCFKQHHSLVFKKLVGDSAVDTNAMDLWFKASGAAGGLQGLGHL